MLLPCLTAWAAWVAWAACTKPPRSPRFRLNKKGGCPVDGQGRQRPGNSKAACYQLARKGAASIVCPCGPPSRPAFFAREHASEPCRQGAVLKWQAAFLSRPGCRMRPPFPALRRVNRAWTFPSLTLPAKGYKKAASLLQLTACVFCGAPEEIRTPGLQVRSLLLYPAELRARCEDVLIEKRTGCQRFSPVITFF